MKKFLFAWRLALASCALSQGAPRRLNNFVTELLDARSPQAGRAYVFHLKRPQFVWLRVDADLYAYGTLRLVVDGSRAAASGDARRRPKFAFGLPEAMVRLGAGRHTVRIDASGLCVLRRLRAHAVPDIELYVYAEDLVYLYGRDSYAAFRWDWAKANGLLNYNTIVTMPPREKAALARWTKRLSWWRGRGGKVILNTGVCGSHARLQPDPELARRAYAKWLPGMASRWSDGVIVDEIGRSPWHVARYAAWLEAARRLARQFPQKDFIFFSVAKYVPQFDPMLQAAAEGPANLFLAPEHYYGDAQSRTLMRSWSAGNFRQWRRRFPGIAGKTHLYLGVGDASTYAGFDWDPAVDYKAFLDEYVKFFAADDRAFDGVRGIGFWKINLCDEEIYRYLSALLRHYCLFGSVERFYPGPLRPGVLTNPGFETGTLEGWDVSPLARRRIAVADTPFTKRADWRRLPQGKKAAVFVISAEGGGRLTQKLRNLHPGRLYSAECCSFTCSAGKSLVRHPIRLDVSGAEVVGRTLRVSHGVRPKLDRLGKIQVCWNQQWVRFRPRSREAVLALSEAASEAQRRPFVGRRIYIDFVQVQPCFTGEVYFPPPARSGGGAPR